MKRVILWLIAVGGGILVVSLSAVVADVGHAHDARVPRLVIFIVSFSYCAIPVLDAAAQLASGITAMRVIRRVVLLPLIVTALTAFTPLAIVATDIVATEIVQMEWLSLLGALIAAILLIPFVWYYVSLYRRLGRTIAGVIEQAKETAGIKST